MHTHSFLSVSRPKDLQAADLYTHKILGGRLAVHLLIDCHPLCKGACVYMQYFIIIIIKLSCTIHVLPTCRAALPAHVRAHMIMQLWVYDQADACYLCFAMLYPAAVWAVPFTPQ